MQDDEPRRASTESLGAVLVEAADRAGVRLRVLDGRLRAAGPAGTDQLIYALLTYEPAVVAAILGQAGSDHDEPYDPRRRYLSDAELARCRRVRERLGADRAA
jgi:hypothetical protein